MKLFILLIIITLCTIASRAQGIKEIIITGTVIDKETKELLPKTTITILNLPDSIVIATFQTNNQGQFSITIGSDKALLLSFRYIGYRSLSKELKTQSENRKQNLHIIELQKTGLTLSVVEIKSPIIVKKDTIEFDASYFNTRDKAAVEELLRKLPGITVDRTGKIIAQGESVRKILIDGKPFFLDDPSLATKNLTADLISKVQVIDQKSDESQFTGIDDGKREKVINLTIKEEKRNKINGNISAALGTDNRFTSNANINRFGKGEQMSLIAKSNNTNNYPDNRTSESPPGLNTISNAGINYNKDIGNKISLNTSYIVDENKNTNTIQTFRQNFLEDGTWTYDQYAESRNRTFANRFQLEAKYKIDSIQELEFATNGFLNSINNRSTNISESRNQLDQLINNGHQNYHTSGRTSNIFSSFSYRRKLRKPGRALSTAVSFGITNGNNHSFNNSINTYHKQGGEITSDSLDQRNILKSKEKFLQYSFALTESLLKSSNLRFSYIFTRYDNSPSKETSDYNYLVKDYTNSNDSLSNNFNNLSSFHVFALKVRTQKPKYDYGLGITYLYNGMKNANYTRKTKLDKDYKILFPSASINFPFSGGRNLRFDYSVNIQQPTIQELQPVPDNANPLYILEGNPDLKPARTDKLNASYSLINPQTMRSLSFKITADLYSNRITYSNYFDSLGRQISRPQNVNGAWNINSGLDQSFQIKFMNAKVSSSTAVGYLRSVNLINGKTGYTNNLTAGQMLAFNGDAGKVMTLGLDLGIQFNNLTYSLQDESNRNFSYTVTLNTTFHLPYGISLDIYGDYRQLTGLSAGYNADFLLLNAGISKSLLKSKKALIKLSGYDLLDQNLSVVRSVGEGYIEDLRTSVLQRFFLLNFTYFF
ncbi:outer membrane beta-barrel protein [Olivibacter domesticus]|uniref:Outer membrane receptor proteins, mostly Fe transport n=1 Tax=Olivibacter domesticus TaxID=407022 RepID=A0A1H7IH79_OLID1|nr:outer membrane beta-barrel protein [Olivibacter domesticus]SEK61856.1 Outer membrane receptor proteins, mostly Fe transport [Olivibacter domesticus]